MYIYKSSFGHGILSRNIHIKQCVIYMGHCVHCVWDIVCIVYVTLVSFTNIY